MILNKTGGLMHVTTEITDFKGFEAVKLCVENAYAIIVPALGSNVVRFRDDNLGVEFFRYSEKVSGAEMDKQREVWGLPSLYLPNRFGKGILRASDAVYQLPINEPAFGNHIHGFLHKRAHTVKSTGIIKESNTAFAETEYIYDKNDEFFQYFPVEFIANVRIELGFEEGSAILSHYIKLTNVSAKMLPVSLCTHTAIQSPFADGGTEANIRLKLPIESRIDIDKSTWLPTGKLNLPLDDYDLQYKKYTMCPVLQDICNDMYKLEKPSERHNVIVIREVGRRIYNVLGDCYKFVIVWNDGGSKGYFCPEPMTAQIDAPNLSLPFEESGYFELTPSQQFVAAQSFFAK
jgi:aldose 1-epimerase